jgi:hypothetical protein
MSCKSSVDLIINLKPISSHKNCDSTLIECDISLNMHFLKGIYNYEPLYDPKWLVIE